MEGACGRGADHALTIRQHGLQLDLGSFLGKEAAGHRHGISPDVYWAQEFDSQVRGDSHGVRMNKGAPPHDFIKEPRLNGPVENVSEASILRRGDILRRGFLRFVIPIEFELQAVMVVGPAKEARVPHEGILNLLSHTDVSPTCCLFRQDLTFVATVFSVAGRIDTAVWHCGSLFPIGRGFYSCSVNSTTGQIRFCRTSPVKTERHRMFCSSTFVGITFYENPDGRVFLQGSVAAIAR
jgi:hypothetical protein